MTDIAKRADIIIGVSSAYEKEGVYVSAMRRLHLSQPLVKSDLPDDWEVIQLLVKSLELIIAIIAVKSFGMRLHMWQIRDFQEQNTID